MRKGYGRIGGRKELRRLIKKGRRKGRGDNARERRGRKERENIDSLDKWRVERKEKKEKRLNREKDGRERADKDKITRIEDE